MKLIQFIKKAFSERGEIVWDIKRVKTSGNVTFLIQTSKAKYFLRLSGKKERARSEEEILAEIMLLEILSKKGIPVPRPIELRGDRVMKAAIGNGICYEALEGSPVEKPSLRECFLAGEMLGRIHKITKDVNIPLPRKKWDLESTQKEFEQVKDEFNQKGFLRENNFVELFELVFDGLTLPKFFPKGMIHEDFGRRHVLFKDEEISGVIDWDRNYEGLLILDIGQAIRGWCVDDWEKLNKEKMDFFMKGYEQQRKLNILEKMYLRKAIQFSFAERALSFAIRYLNESKKEDGEFAVKNINIAKTI